MRREIYTSLALCRPLRRIVWTEKKRSKRGVVVATQAAPKSGFDKWKEGILRAPGDPKWDIWDREIRTAVSEFNQHLATTTGYVPLDWRVVKAMVWVESGAGNPQWLIKPMQIGVVGDAGMDALLSGNEGGDLILPPIWKERLTVLSVRTVPSHNIRAGIGYLLMKAAYYEHRSVSPAGSSVFEVTVQPGDSLDKIARANGSTTEVMTRLNPTAGTLRVGQVLKCQKAVLQRVIVGWRPMTPALLVGRYNGGGDATYRTKINTTLSLVLSGRE
ncbi:LysM domain-containing protein [Variovorax sp. YR752]|uniref:LysM peptidoglycan-binding domain-containing protein n=1 Tax=Variovorax sp. YR752 TaxID=1884383 RepID=UPI0031381EF8